MNIGENLKRLRKARGLTQAALAEAVGVGAPMIAQIERGTKALSVQLAVAIAQTLHCTVGELAGTDKEQGKEEWRQE